MISSEFIDKVLIPIKVNGPIHRDALMPTFIKEKINESKFNDNLRLKSMEIKRIDEDTVEVNWTSKYWDDDYNSFFKEVKRCFIYNAKKHKLENPIEVIVNLSDVYDTNEVRNSFTLNSFK